MDAVTAIRTDTLAANDEEPAALVVCHDVLPGKHQAYEEWLKVIREQCRRYAGHLGPEVIRPHPGAPNTYTVIVRFDSVDHLETWLRSSERKEAIHSIEPILAKGDSVDVRPGFDVWFTPSLTVRTPRSGSSTC